MSRILLDQNLPRALASLLHGDDVRHATEEGWQELTNGDLLAAAEASNFAVLVSADQNIRYQQNLAGRTIALVVLSTNAWRVLRQHHVEIAAALARASTGSYEHVALPRPPLRRRPPPVR